MHWRRWWRKGRGGNCEERDTGGTVGKEIQWWGSGLVYCHGYCLIFAVIVTALMLHSHGYCLVSAVIVTVLMLHCHCYCLKAALSLFLSYFCSHCYCLNAALSWLLSCFHCHCYCLKAALSLLMPSVLLCHCYSQSIFSLCFVENECLKIAH